MLNVHDSFLVVNLYSKMRTKLSEYPVFGPKQDLMKLKYLANSILKSNKQLIKEVMRHDRSAFQA